VFDDLLDLASLSRGDRNLEIGCGTGQATLPLAARGLAITAVELGPALADRARARVQPFRTVEVVTSAFEDWREPAQPFRAVVAVNSLHWVDPDQRYTKPARLLVPGGAMAVATCHWARPADADPFFFDVQEDYQAVGWAGDPPPEPDAIRLWHFRQSPSCTSRSWGRADIPSGFVTALRTFLRISAHSAACASLGMSGRKSS